MIERHAVQLLELQARLASALGQLREVINCTICGVAITGPSQKDHQVDCILARELNVSVPKSEPKAKTSMDFSFSTKPKLAKPHKKASASKPPKGAKRIVNKTGDQFRDANGKFDRHAWATDKAAKRKAAGVPLFANKEQLQLMGIPAGIGGL